MHITEFCFDKQICPLASVTVGRNKEPVQPVFLLIMQKEL